MKPSAGKYSGAGGAVLRLSAAAFVLYGVFIV